MHYLNVFKVQSVPLMMVFCRNADVGKDLDEAFSSEKKGLKN